MNRSSKVITLALLSSAIFLEGCNKTPKKTAKTPYDATSGTISNSSGNVANSVMPWYMFWGGGGGTDYDHDRRHYGSNGAHGVVSTKSAPVRATAPASGASKSVSSSFSGSSSRGGFGGIGGGMGASS